MRRTSVLEIKSGWMCTRKIIMAKQTTEHGQIISENENVFTFFCCPLSFLAFHDDEFVAFSPS
jgi:hypothetical protein